jgi:DNA alkylation repair enzyme
MRSGVHEERSLAGAILRRYEKSTEAGRAQIFNFYVRNRRLVRSWDTVDDTAPNILGRHLLRRDKKLLYRLAGSRNLWVGLLCRDLRAISSAPEQSCRGRNISR